MSTMQTCFQIKRIALLLVIAIGLGACDSQGGRPQPDLEDDQPDLEDDSMLQLFREGEDEAFITLTFTTPDPFEISRAASYEKPDLFELGDILHLSGWPFGTYRGTSFLLVTSEERGAVVFGVNHHPSHPGYWVYGPWDEDGLFLESILEAPAGTRYIFTIEPIAQELPANPQVQFVVRGGIEEEVRYADTLSYSKAAATIPSDEVIHLELDEATRESIDQDDIEVAIHARSLPENTLPMMIYRVNSEGWRAKLLPSSVGSRHSLYFRNNEYWGGDDQVGLDGLYVVFVHLDADYRVAPDVP